MRDLARTYPVITLTGPRQSGKTTLARATFSDFDYVSLEAPDERHYALDDPRGFLSRFRGPAIIDEAQNAPGLFSYIQGIVDDAGVDEGVRFVLTGSQHFLLLERTAQSLAGRVAVTHLLPFSLAELGARRHPDLESFGGPLEPVLPTPDADLFEVLFRGFYPRIHDRGIDPQVWLRNYYETYIQRDVRSVLNVGDLDTFDRFVRLCAGRAGQILNLSGLAGDAGITHTTARRWLSVLETGFIVRRTPPHHRNFGKRLIKSPKLHFLDSGLLCYLLGIREPAQLHHHSARGAVFETFVFAELLKNHLHRDDHRGIYFWRDSRGREVDFILEGKKGLVGIETKSSLTLASDACRVLDQWRALSGEDCGGTCLVYGGDTQRIWNDTAVYPWHVL